MIESALGDVERLAITLAGAAVTALCAYLFKVLRAWLGVVESDSNEGEIRRAALTEAGKLIVSGKIADPNALLDSASKVIGDLTPAVKAEGYDVSDIKDMILGAAGTVFPPANLLKLLK